MPVNNSAKNIYHQHRRGGQTGRRTDAQTPGDSNDCAYAERRAVKMLLRPI